MGAKKKAAPIVSAEEAEKPPFKPYKGEATLPGHTGKKTGTVIGERNPKENEFDVLFEWEGHKHWIKKAWLDA